MNVKLGGCVSLGGLRVEPAQGVTVRGDALVITSGGEYALSGMSTTARAAIGRFAAEVTLHMKDVMIDVSDGEAPALLVESCAGVTVVLEGSSMLLGGGRAAGLMNGTNPVEITGEGALIASGGCHGGAGVGGGETNDDGDAVCMRDGANITISGGHVTAIGGYGAAGVGGSGGLIPRRSEGGPGNGAHIRVTGGTLHATGGLYGAGIGGGRKCTGEDIEISGGAVIARGGSGAAGIGGHDGGSFCGGGKDIRILGGTVVAHGGDKAAGIGGGNMASGCALRIRGGKVIARGGEKGAGIGGGCDMRGEDIEISGGDVTAVGGEWGAGVGGGATGKGTDIRISGGKLIAHGGEDAGGVGGGFLAEGEDITVGGGRPMVVSFGGDAENLTPVATDKAVKLDGVADEAVWFCAAELTITADGKKNDGTQTGG